MPKFYTIIARKIFFPNFGHLLPSKNSEKKYFSGNYHVKYFQAKLSCSQSLLSSYAYAPAQQANIQLTPPLPPLPSRCKNHSATYRSYGMCQFLTGCDGNIMAISALQSTCRVCQLHADCWQYCQSSVLKLSASSSAAFVHTERRKFQDIDLRSRRVRITRKN